METFNLIPTMVCFIEISVKVISTTKVITDIPQGTSLGSVDISRNMRSMQTLRRS